MDSKEKTDELYSVILKFTHLCRNLDNGVVVDDIRVPIFKNKFKIITILTNQRLDIEKCKFAEITDSNNFYEHEYDYCRFEIGHNFNANLEIRERIYLNETFKPYYDTFYKLIDNLNDYNKERLIDIFESKIILMS